MRILAMLAVLAAVIGGWSAPVRAEAPAATTPPPARAEVAAEPILTPTLAMVAGGVIGIVLVSGAINVATAAGLVVAGTGLVEALQTGASLTMPTTILAAILGAVYGPEVLTRNGDPAL